MWLLYVYFASTALITSQGKPVCSMKTPQYLANGLPLLQNNLTRRLNEYIIGLQKGYTGHVDSPSFPIGKC